MNDLIDRLRGWCPKETLLRIPQHGRVSRGNGFWLGLLKERPLEAFVSFAILAVGLAGLLIPSTFMPAKVRVYILTGSELALEHCAEDESYWVCTPLISPSTAVIDGSDTRGSFEIEGTPSATASLNYPSRNVTIKGSAPIGLDIDPEWRRHDVEMAWGTIYYRVFLSKDGWKRELGEGGGPTQEHFQANLQALEDEEGVAPPYNITCVGSVRHRLDSSIDEARGEYHLTFWSLGVAENSTLTVTRYADIPVEKMLVENLALKTLKGLWLPFTLIGLAALAVLYHKMGA